MMNRKSSRRGQRGAALIESLVSIVVFSLGVVGIVALQAKASQFSVDSEDRTRAAMFANELASKMWEQNSTSLDPATISAWQNRVQAAGSGLPSANASCIVANGMATITISWHAPWRNTPQQENSYMTQVTIQ